MKSDSQIQQDVMNQLKWEPSLTSSSIGVFVKDGIVTLTGQVDSYYKKIEAEKAAKKISGVRAVAEDIHVGISPLHSKTDTEIAELVLNALKWHPEVKQDQIKIKVEDGYVTLEGEVDWNYERVAARNAIANLTGVRGVYNLITLRPAVAAVDIKSKIKAALERSASVDANNITVEVNDHTVTLKGKVRSFAEMEDARAAAWAAPGVNYVNDQLELQIEEEQYTF